MDYREMVLAIIMACGWMIALMAANEVRGRWRHTAFAAAVVWPVTAVTIVSAALIAYGVYVVVDVLPGEAKAFAGDIQRLRRKPVAP